MMVTAIAGIAALVGFWITLFAAWVTHVIHTIVNEQWVLMVVGAFIVPIGIIHGFIIWLGIV